VDWNRLAEGRDKWWVLMKTAMNFSKYWEILECLSNWQLLKKDSAPRS
jgi:hypothetical protein